MTHNLLTASTTMNRDTTLDLDQGIRRMDDSELAVVNGGLLNDGGCILHPNGIGIPVPGSYGMPKPFVDVFARHGL
jgi:hypothetical protein